MTARMIVLACIAVFTLPTLAASGDAEVGRKKSEPCKACHGEGGISASPDFPNLAGQHADYMIAALNHYKNGKRKNPIMQGQVANLSHKDILDLTAYYSQQPGLKIKY
jgi:cytochrome c553